MKKTIFIALLVFSCAVRAQDNGFFIREEAGYLQPIGTLHQRFMGTTVEAVAFGKKINENTTWIGRIEYFRFTELNKDKLYYTRTIKPYSKEYLFRLPLDKLSMDLEGAGLTAEMQKDIYNNSFFQSRLSLGFGIYRWQSYRSGYKDSVYASIPDNDTLTSTKLKLVEGFNVPSLVQQDWSGGFYAGAEIGIEIADPLWLTASAHYKVIVGELWAALKMDMENVSGMQMAMFKVGLSLRLR